MAYGFFRVVLLTLCCIAALVSLGNACGKLEGTMYKMGNSVLGAMYILLAAYIGGMI